MNRTKDGQAIAYEGQSYSYFTGTVSGTPTSGNPTHYPTSTGQYDLEWTDGRKLEQMVSADRQLSFTYGQDGLRTTKNVSSVLHNYYYAGGKLLRETCDGNTLDFAYDANGVPYSLTYNGTKYYYITNLQGDVMYLVNSSGTKVASYTYSPYGEVLTATGSMANINPLRYRGYYYDSETGLYYLQSRYYNPVAGRWINADGYASTGQGILGYNMFAYCCNSPVSMIDSTGRRCVPAEFCGGGYSEKSGLKKATDWVDNDIPQPAANFFSPSTNTISGQFQEGILQGSGSLTGGYSLIMARVQVTQQELPEYKEAISTIGVFGKVSVGNASGKIGVGGKNFSIAAKGVGDVLVATGQAGLTYQDGCGVKLKAKAAVATGRATVECNIFGWQMELGVYGEALACGAEATIGVFDGAFEAKMGASALFGGGFVLRIKPS